MEQQLINYAKPILFNGDMVCAILDGKKTCTRRYADAHAPLVEKRGNGFFCAFPNGDGSVSLGKRIRQICKEGDVLYVRETWSFLKQLTPDGTIRKMRYVYRATDTYPFGEKYIANFKWHPSIHMPKDAARIFLKVNNVTIERLQDISDEDIKAEGAENKEDFIRIWDSTVKKSELLFNGWEANPWVVVYYFEKID